MSHTMNALRSALRATPRLANVSHRPASPGKFNLSPRFTSILQARDYAAGPDTKQRVPTAQMKTRDEGMKAQHLSRVDEQGFASETRGPPAPPQKERLNLEHGKEAPTFLGTTKRLPEFNLADKVILVTGGARGLGLTQAEALMEAGATVYCLDRLPEPSPNFEVIKKRAAETLGTDIHYRQIDIRDVPNVNKIISEIADKHQRLDGLLHAAGIQQETPALDYTAEDVNRMLEVNVTGSFMVAQATAKSMIKYDCAGSIVFIASMSASIANRGLICPAYNASKAGVLQLARNLASEWGMYKIRVNTISPGYIVTEMVERLFENDPSRRTEWGEQNMLGRVSAPAEYRGAAVFLISEASSYMTGADCRMDGGHAAW
ncbi:MAG: hypothetical protein M1831_002693 [Alyxoria varia]|nr:MAG: hypothetical protein M1831_002693 [Alyxoria varia]